nr:MAG TPA: hypothetical protein [Caudoviricetes sp.]
MWINPVGMLARHAPTGSVPLIYIRSHHGLVIFQP